MHLSEMKLVFRILRTNKLCFWQRLFLFRLLLPDIQPPPGFPEDPAEASRQELLWGTGLHRNVLLTEMDRNPAVTAQKGSGFQPEPSPEHGKGTDATC